MDLMVDARCYTSFESTKFCSKERQYRGVINLFSPYEIFLLNAFFKS